MRLALLPDEPDILIAAVRFSLGILNAVYVDDRILFALD
jgi:hypothetical protein